MAIGIHICSGSEWRATKSIIRLSPEEVHLFPYGEFFIRAVSGRQCVFYHSRRTKTRAAGACQYAIDHWNIDPLLVIGTCGRVAEGLSILDLILATGTVQYDNQDRRAGMGYSVQADLSWFRPDSYPTLHAGLIASADHDLTFADLELLRREHIFGADWESGAIATVCFLNRTRWAIVRGISDIPLRSSPEDVERQIGDYQRHAPTIMRSLLGLLSQLIIDLSA